MSFSQLPALKKTSFLVGISDKCRPFLFRYGFIKIQYNLVNLIFHKTNFRTSLDPREKEEYQNSPFFGINLGIDDHGGSVNVGDKVFAIKNNDKSSLIPCLLLFPLPILLMFIWKRKYFL